VKPEATLNINTMGMVHTLNKPINKVWMLLIK